MSSTYPDLMDGKTFATLDEGMAYVRGLSFDTIIAAASRRGGRSPDRARVCGNVARSHACANARADSAGRTRRAPPPRVSAAASEFGGWPAGVSAQIHTMDADEYGDVDVTREFAASVADVETFEYPGDRHLFTDPSLDDYDEAAATQVRDRARAFLSGIA